MGDGNSVAEQIRELLVELHGQVVTREKVPHYRQVRRASERTVAVLDWREHVTTAPGLLAQLGVVQVHVRDGVVLPGAAVPGGSPGWDADGALAPLMGGGDPDGGEPVTEEWHVADGIRADLAALGRDLAERGWKPGEVTLVDIALRDQGEGRWIVGRLRGMVTNARIAADYDAPIVPLRDVYCPECGGQLRVRKDASSGVWCAGVRDAEGRRVGARWIAGPAVEGQPWPIPVCDATWPRGAWVALLEELDNQEAS